MKVKLLVSRSGADGAFAPGDEIEVSDAEAKRMIAGGQCVPAVSDAREKTTRKRAKETR